MLTWTLLPSGTLIAEMFSDTVPVGSGRLVAPDGMERVTSCDPWLTTATAVAKERPRKVSWRTAAPLAGSTSEMARSKELVVGQLTPSRKLFPHVPSLAAMAVSAVPPPTPSSRITAAFVGLFAGGPAFPEATRTTQASVPPFRKNCWMA